MSKTFYMWLCFGTSAAVILIVWVYAFAKSVGAVTPEIKKKNTALERSFIDIENKLEGFRAANDAYFKSKSVEARVALEQDAALQRLKEKLESTTSTSE